MGGERSHTTLDRAEWDFPDTLAGQKLTACFVYEYARESKTLRAAAAEIQALRKQEWCEFCERPREPRLVWKGKRLTFLEFIASAKRAEVRDFYASCTEAEAQAHERFLSKHDEYRKECERRDSLPLFYEAAEAVIRKHGIKSPQYQGNLEFIVEQPFFPDTPWQCLTPEQQDAVRKYPVTCQPLAPGNLKELRAVSDAVPQCECEQTPKKGTAAYYMWPDYSCHPYVLDMKAGQETRPFTIDWKGSRDEEIRSAFAAWLKDRRQAVGIPEPRHRRFRRSVGAQGRGGDADVRGRLFHLGVTRLLNCCDIQDIAAQYADAALRWIESERHGMEQYMSGANVQKCLSHARKCWDSFLKQTRSDEREQSVRERFVDYHRRAARATFHDLFPFDRHTPQNYPLA
jgi:hypothetical protein